MVAVIELEEAKSFEEVREEKTWLTSSEASQYIIDECPNVLRGLGGKAYAKEYRNLYKMVDVDRVLSGRVEYNSSGQRVRFYLKEDLDRLENIIETNMPEHALFRRKVRQLARTRDANEKIAKLEEERDKALQDANEKIAKLEKERAKAWALYMRADYQLQIKEDGCLGWRVGYWNYCL